MIRYTLLWIFIAWVSTVAWKDWYKGACGLILLTAVLERPDMPHSILGIPGLNPWNILLLVTVCSWLLHKQREGLHGDMPRGIKSLLILQLLLFTIGLLRVFFDGAGLEEIRALQAYGYQYPTGAGLWNNYFINTFKWVVPGLLLYYGCNSRPRLLMALFSLLAMYLVLSLLVYKAIPPWKIIDVSSLTKYAIKLDTRVGYHRVDLSAMLAGASWAFFSVIILIRQGWQRAGLLMAGGMAILAMGLTGGRAGYMAWGLTGVIFGLFRWRKLLILMPIAVLLLLTFIPQIRDRIMVGLDSTEETGYTESGNEVDVNALTAGRDRIWHLALEQFQKAPLLGHGRLAILRTGMNREAIIEFRESYGHPHSAYIEQLIDNGVIGLMLVLLFYLAMLRKSFSLLRDTSNPLYVAVGGVAMAIILTQLIAALTAQSFYPRQGVVGMWCAIGLMLRVYVEREKARQAHTPALIWEIDNRSQTNR
jgi:O-antigen ligase